MDGGAAQERMEMALELCELAEAMLREKLRRTSPTLSPKDLEAKVDAWFMQRPGAEHGDAEGREIPWPRPRK